MPWIKPGVLFDADSPLDLTGREKSDLVERLRGRFPNFKQRRSLLMRISGSCENGVALDPRTDCTVEHILPRTPSKDRTGMRNGPRRATAKS